MRHVYQLNKRRGRVPTMMQMRLLLAAWVGMSGGRAWVWYEAKFGCELNRNSMYAVYATMAKRGWLNRTHGPAGYRRNEAMYSLTKTGRQWMAYAIAQHSRLLDGAEEVSAYTRG